VFSVVLTRNRFVAALANAVLIAHAQPGSKTEQLAQEVVGWGKQVCTLDHAANEHLLAWGRSRRPCFRRMICRGMKGKKPLASIAVERRWIVERPVRWITDSPSTKAAHSPREE